MINSILKNFISQLKVRDIDPIHLEKRGYKRVIFVGFGGSGLGARMIISLREILEVPQEIRLDLSQNYSLPKDLSRENDLLIVASYSGKTLEAITCAEEARKKGASFILLSSDGSLKKLAEEWKNPFYLIEEAPSPRFSLSSQFYLLASLLFKLGIVKKTPSDLSNLSFSSERTKAEAMSQSFLGKIILIYSSLKNNFLAYDLKIRLNEDGKLLAFSNFLPEAVHNEFLSLERNREKTKAIFLKGGEEENLFLKHLDCVSGIFKEKKIEFEILEIGKKSIENYFKQIIFNISFSYFLAKENSVDFLENDFLKEIKEKFSS